MFESAASRPKAVLGRMNVEKLLSVKCQMSDDVRARTLLVEDSSCIIMSRSALGTGFTDTETGACSILKYKLEAMARLHIDGGSSAILQGQQTSFSWEVGHRPSDFKRSADIRMRAPWDRQTIARCPLPCFWTEPAAMHHHPESRVVHMFVKCSKYAFAAAIRPTQIGSLTVPSPQSHTASKLQASP